MRAALSVTIAAALLAAHVVLLTLYLNPSASLRGDGGALALALFLPDFVLAAAALGIGVVLTRVFVREARARRPPVEGLPYFASLTFVVCAVSAALFWTNLWSYRHSIPLEHVRGLAASSIA